MTEVVFLCHTDEVSENSVKQVCPPGFDDGLAVYCIDGEFYATDDLCTHALVSLSQGDVADGQIFCPLHGGAFDIRTGKPTEFPCTVALKTYPVIRKENQLFLTLSEE